MKSFWGGRRLAGRDAVSAAIGLSVVLFSGCTLFLGAFKIKCGDGFLQEPEACDDGNQTSGDGCEADCSLSCGNDIIDTGEQCDDGNNTDGDGCSSNCQTDVCGDRAVTAPEECDDGNTLDGDECEADCTNPFCGNSIPDIGELCDDGNNISTDSCINCQNSICGDGFLFIGLEQCDDGNNTDSDGCSGICEIEPPTNCGNGILDSGEVCDQGPNNSQNPDALCRVDCTIARCGDGVTDPGIPRAEQCDDGNNQDGDACESNCIAPFCGNGIVDNEEECDDGNTTSGDGCESTCVSGSTCGNNVADTGEFCGFTIQVINNPAFQEPISLTAADFIQGGPNELAIANAENNTVAILSKNAGTFNVSTIAVGVNPNQVIAAELSTGGSDIADLVVVCNGGSIDLLDGNGDGTFTGNSLISTQPLSAAVGDVDLDGDPDLFFTEQTTNSFSFFLDGGLGNGQSFTTLASPPVDITVGSFRGATLDVAVLGRTTGSVDIFLNNGISFPSAPNQTITGLSGPNALAQGDLNEDSLIDLVVAEGLSNRISVFNGLGCTANACFTPTGIPAFTGNNPSSVVVGDLDRDGQLDVVTANLDSGTVSVLLNLGTGSFQAKQDFSIGTAEAPSDVVLADLDNDGVLDLATTNFTSENITIFLGKK